MAREPRKTPRKPINAPAQIGFVLVPILYRSATASKITDSEMERLTVMKIAALRKRGAVIPEGAKADFKMGEDFHIGYARLPFEGQAELDRVTNAIAILYSECYI